MHKKIDQLVLDHQKTLNEKDQTINRLSKELRINKDINKQTDETNQTLSIRVNDLENAVVESKENGRVLKNNVEFFKEQFKISERKNLEQTHVVSNLRLAITNQQTTINGLEEGK